jgi:hypothetical protein
VSGDKNVTFIETTPPTSMMKLLRVEVYSNAV